MGRGVPEKAWTTTSIRLHEESIAAYPGFKVPNKAYWEVTQWQGKEMRNLGRCISAVFASALRNPDGSQQLPFKRAIQWVCSLIDFTLMAQYRSYTLETLGYMETYFRTIHRTKDIFLEFHTTKAISAQAECQDRELRKRIANANRTMAPLDRPPTDISGSTKLGLKGPTSGLNWYNGKTTSILSRCITEITLSSICDVLGLF